MASPIDEEPWPRPPGERPVPVRAFSEVHPLPQHVDATSPRFFEVLSARRSRTGSGISNGRIGSLLWHSMQLRERNFGGRFGQWESRATPSAGGLHPIRVLVLPTASDTPAGLYADDRHALCLCGTDPRNALALNLSSVVELSGATTGTTLQLVADTARIASCYDNYETLLWRDAGALTMTLCLVAEALGMTALPLGRIGTDIVQAFGLEEPIVALGAVHIGEHSDRT